jgi:dihydropteroate synthase
VSEKILWRVGDRLVDCGARTHVMGIINVTPDSFSDGGRFFDPEVAIAAGVRMVEEGADFLDVGGESTRPGSDPVPVQEEIHRVVPVIKRLAGEVDVPLSVDTRKHEVAGAALDVGASIVNDVTAGSDPGMFDVVRGAGAAMVLMHMRGDPKTMQQLTDYRDVVAEVRDHLAGRVEDAVARGIDRDRLAIDPGLGFAKTEDQNYLLMKDIREFLSVGRPVVVGPSRKSFIGKVLGTQVDDRIEGTAGAVAWMAGQGAHIVRVHDVKAMVQVVRVVDAIARASEGRTA